MSNKDWLVISIITFLTVAVWTVYEIYHTAVTTTVTPVQEKLIDPFEPTFDEEVFKTLQERND
ncbi:hypothetical protein HY468_04965 [Candidatus Roizmanbacteria bacterium]|nr:hypothetical protein [Candidatus Roizmanbacteria bacterium]